MGSHPLNLALRFLLEIAALVAIGYWGFSQHAGIWRFVMGLGGPRRLDVAEVTKTGFGTSSPMRKMVSSGLGFVSSRAGGRNNGDLPRMTLTGDKSFTGHDK